MENRLISEITALEWQMFDQVQNQGGRASCQDDWQTFSIMRTSQLSAWEERTLASYREDLLSAQAAGRNLLQEKYAYMMASTAPEEFVRIQHLLPPIEPARKQQIEALAALQIREMEMLAQTYPHVAATMRPLRSIHDSLSCTSFETYLKGELSTYSAKTLSCYSDQLVRHKGAYSYAILNQTALQYGCQNLEELEALLKRIESNHVTS